MDTVICHTNQHNAAAPVIVAAAAATTTTNPTIIPTIIPTTTPAVVRYTEASVSDSSSQVICVKRKATQAKVTFSARAKSKARSLAALDHSGMQYNDEAVREVPQQKRLVSAEALHAHILECVLLLCIRCMPKPKRTEEQYEPCAEYIGVSVLNDRCKAFLLGKNIHALFAKVLGVNNVQRVSEIPGVV
jgi:hypothetical protein